MKLETFILVIILSSKFACYLNFCACLAIFASCLSLIAIFSRSYCYHICSSSLVNMLPSFCSYLWVFYSFIAFGLITALSPDFDLDLDLDFDLDFFIPSKLIILRYFLFNYDPSLFFSPKLSSFYNFLFYNIGDLLS